MQSQAPSPSRDACKRGRLAAEREWFAQTPVRRLIRPALRAGLRYDVLVRDTALRSPLTHEEIVATLRSFLGSRIWPPISSG